MEKFPADREIVPAVMAPLRRWSGAQRIGQWLRAHGDLAALAVIAAGFVIQVVATRDRSLTSDEAFIFSLVNVPGPIDAYRRAWSDPHPPLFYMLLHLWTRFGHSESFLRLLPAAFGGGFLWFVYRWAGGVFGRASGLLTLVVLALSSEWLPLSSQVRNYSLVLMLSAAALAEFERSVEAESEARVLLSSLFLYLAILSHYSALFIAISLAVYELIRLRKAHVSRRLFLVWAGCQGGVAILYLSLYFIQIKDLRGSGREERAISGWLTAGYFHRDRENPAWFVARQTWEVFRYFFGSAGMAAIALLLAVAGVVILAMKRRSGAVVLTLPYLLGATAGLLGLYPLTGTRHSSYLLLFVSVAIGVALSAIIAARRWTLLLALAILVCLCWTTPAWETAAGSLSRMKEAMDQLRRRAAPGSLLFADQRTGTELSYYLGFDALKDRRDGFESFRERDAGDYCLVETTLWTPDPRTFCDEFERMIRVYRLPAGQRLWVVRLGSEFDPAAVLSNRLPNTVFPTRLKFGELSIIEVWLGDRSEPPISFSALRESK